VERAGGDGPVGLGSVVCNCIIHRHGSRFLKECESSVERDFSREAEKNWVFIFIFFLNAQLFP